MIWKFLKLVFDVSLRLREIKGQDKDLLGASSTKMTDREVWPIAWTLRFLPWQRHPG